MKVDHSNSFLSPPSRVMRPSRTAHVTTLLVASVLLLLSLLSSAPISLTNASPIQTTEQRKAARDLAQSSSSTGYAAPGIAATDSYPSSYVATWIDLSELVASDPEAGKPLARCDHTFESLHGQSFRKNERVPFPDNTAPTFDPYANHIWLMGGHESDEYNDSWFLNVTERGQPAWSRIQYTNPDSDVHPRWGIPVSFLPNGLHPNDTGLTVVTFSGATNEDYVPLLQTFNFASRTWRTLMSVTIGDPTVPFPRGYFNWWSLPSGYGSDMFNPTTDSGDLFMVGGLGSPNLGHYGKDDQDYADQWIFNVGDVKWKRFGTYECVQPTYSCSDETLLTTFLTSIVDAAANSSSAIDFTKTIRPADIYPEIQAILSALAVKNLTATTLQNDPSTCSAGCAAYEAQAAYNSLNQSIVFTPRGIEGARGVVVDGFLWEFGGYMCTQAGVQQLGGDACFLGSMWVLDLQTMEWSSIDPPAATDPTYSLWPTKRAYNTIAAYPDQHLIIVQGGAYQDTSGVMYYYNDIFAFSTKLRTFVPLKVGGPKPALAWSAGLTTVDSSMFLFGGCQGSVFYDQLFELRIGLEIDAGNCYASGEGLLQATAGEQASFWIQTREVLEKSINGSTTVFGANATYGTALQILAQLVSDNTKGDATSELNLVPATVVEMGLGLYNVSYVASYGSQYKLFISVSNQQIPGSPFTVALSPGSTPEAARTVVSGGYGSSLVAKNELSMLQLQLKDTFSNQLTDSSEWVSQSSYESIMAALQAELGTASLVATNNSSSTANVTTSEVATVPNWNYVAAGYGTVTFLTKTNDSSLHFDASYTNQLGVTRPLSFVIQNQMNGSFSMAYIAPTDSDWYSLELKVNGNDVHDSPFAVEALNPVKVSSAVKIAFVVLASISLCLFVAASVFVQWFRNEPVLRSSSPNFLHMIILGAAVTSVAVIMLSLEPSDMSCQAFHTTLSLGMTLSMAALLAKSFRVERIFNAKQLKVQSNLTDGALLIPTVCVALAMLLLNLLWIGINPMQKQLMPVDDARLAPVLSFAICSGHAVNSWLAAILAYFALILLYAVFLAVKTGQLPEIFNESKIIAAATYNLFFCSIIVIPLLFFLGNASSFLTGRAVLEAIPIIWCSAFNVFALIIPKVRLVYKIKNGSMKDPIGIEHTYNSNIANGDRKSQILTSNVKRYSANGGGAGVSSMPPLQLNANHRGSLRRDTDVHASGETIRSNNSSGPVPASSKSPTPLPMALVPQTAMPTAVRIVAKPSSPTNRSSFALAQQLAFSNPSNLMRTIGKAPSSPVHSNLAFGSGDIQTSRISEEGSIQRSQTNTRSSDSPKPSKDSSGDSHHSSELATGPEDAAIVAAMNAEGAMNAIGVTTLHLPVRRMDSVPEAPSQLPSPSIEDPLQSLNAEDRIDNKEKEKEVAAAEKMDSSPTAADLEATVLPLELDSISPLLSHTSFPSPASMAYSSGVEPMSVIDAPRFPEDLMRRNSNSAIRRNSNSINQTNNHLGFSPSLSSVTETLRTTNIDSTTETNEASWVSSSGWTRGPLLSVKRQSSLSSVNGGTENAGLTIGTDHDSPRYNEYSQSQASPAASRRTSGNRRIRVHAIPPPPQ